ncbi:histidine kinase [Salegentibacter sp. F188]|uniref:Histidine kinase n=1 Tax=Autumnicola patrickiae TaxID=3075591 RepID=A0ABU3DXN4_9FLAO|nr:histidine kinase [Salegentibacter sp. F188]MDT0688408.1 histidine kinase [Salegentibacter sp. F188]
MASISKDSSQHYRITYEAYSKFANGINRCGTLQEVVEDTKRHLKYLLNFHLIKMVFEQDDHFLFFSLCKNEMIYSLAEEDSLLHYERELFKSGIPLKTSEIPFQLFDGRFSTNELIKPELWAWSFQKNERKALVSLISDENKPFSYADVEILKLVTDCLEAKFQEIFLKNQLANKNKSLSEAYDTIKKQHTQIKEIVENQKQTIEERTREIREKNQKLLHISALNAHNVREPLSRIQGITQLLEVFDDETCRKELFPKLATSVEEMDLVLKEVIEMASQELVKLKAENT